MRRKLFAGSSALLLIAVALLFIFPGSHVFAANMGAVSSTSVAAPTPDATAVVNAANNAVSQAQNLLNIMSVFVGIFAVVLTLFTVFALVVGFLGFNSYRDLSRFARDLRTDLANARRDADNTRSALVYLSLGDRLLSQKDTEEAIKNYQEAGRLLPNDSQVQYMLGRIYSGVGDYGAAINTLEATNPADAVSQAKVEKELGLAYRRRAKANKQEADADYNTAIQHLKKAISLDPTDSEVLAILGGLYRRKGEYALAYSYYEQAWHLNPASSYALGNLASLAWHEGKLEDARKYFSLAEMVANDHIKKGQGEIYWDYYDLALAQVALGKAAEAQKTYATAIKETPGKVQFESVLNNLYLLQKGKQLMPGLDGIVKMIEAAEKVA